MAQFIRIVLGIGFLIGAIALLSCRAAWSQDTDAEEYATGVEPLSPEEFATIPKTPVYRSFLPDRVDLSSLFPAPGNQKNQDSCVGWAVGYAARAYYASFAENRNTSDLNNIPSPFYIYNSIKKDTGNCRVGTKIQDALDLLKNAGSLSYSRFNVRTTQCRPPTDAERTAATDFRITNWLGVDFTSVDQIKAELAKKHPVIVSLRTPTPFHRLSRGTVYSLVGGLDNKWHAITVVGYDERRQAFKLINSWGAEWADGGFGWISYDSFRSEVREAYVMRPLSPVVPAPKPQPPGPVVVKPPAPPKPVVVRPDPEPKPDPQPFPSPTPVSIAGLECARVQTVQREGKSIVTGFVSSRADLERVAEQASASQIAVEVVLRPWPQCEVLLTLETALSQAQRPTVQIANTGKAADAGNYLRFTVTTPAYPSFLHVAYIQANGSVVHLVQPENISLTAYPPSSKIVLGDPAGQGPKFKITPPYGREMLVVISSRSPLFPALRPTEETEREFLTALRKALVANPEASAPGRHVAAGFDAIVTSDLAVTPTEDER